jgi:DNA-3-methyladenine glycosylase
MIQQIENRKLKRSFYKRDVRLVAKELLGKLLVRIEKDFYLAGRIVEVEAYDGFIDQAAHSFRGKTERNKVMFYEGGHFYVYFTYGAHYCCNVVTGEKDEGMAVLIRAVEPVEGVKYMSINRYGRVLLSDKEKINLTNGPGKVCSAFAVTKADNGTDLLGDRVFIALNQKIEDSMIGISKRIGIKKSIELEWRFFIKGNPYVSRK